MDEMSNQTNFGIESLASAAGVGALTGLAFGTMMVGILGLLGIEIEPMWVLATMPPGAIINGIREYKMHNKAENRREL